MAQQTKEQRLAAVHERALERFDKCYASQREIRLQCARDRRFVFVPGAQYEGDLEEQFKNRPRFEVNKVHQSVIRIFSEYRNNRVTVDFRPDDEAISDQTADFLDGLYRADEQDSGGQDAYDTAFEEGVAGGMGAWRLKGDYQNEDEEDEDLEEGERPQRICIEPIPDADNSVWFDIDAKRYDKADASHCFVISGMQAGSYAEMDGADTAAADKWRSTRKRLDPAGKGLSSFDKVERMGVFDWFQPDIVYVAEYYEVELVNDKVSVFKHMASGEEKKLRTRDFDTREEFDAAAQDLLDQGFRLAREKKVKRRQVHKYIIDGARVLEDCGVIAGKHIPVVPFYAKRLFVDNIERIMGQVRLATDLQRLYNMLVSLLAEISVTSPVEKPIFTPAQIAGLEKYWALDNVERYPYQLINPVTDPSGQQIAAGPLGYTKPPAIPPALAGLLQLIGMDLQEVLGSSGDQQEVVSNISAKAVELIQNRLDMQNFIYMDNFKKSMRRSGEIWLSMAKDLYDEDERPMRTVGLDGTDSMEKLRVPAVDKDGKEYRENDPAAGKFKVVADVGPSFTTRRDGTVRAITGLMQFVEDPADRSVLTNVAIQNLEGEGLEDVKRFFRRKGILLGVIKPTDEEAEEIAKMQSGEQPDPNSVFLLASAEKARAQAKESASKAALNVQKIKESDANIAKLLSMIQDGKLDRLLAVADRMQAGQQQPAQPEALSA